MYTGVLRSGKTYSEVFDDLQIITTANFQLAQKLMEERVNEYNEKRTMPKNTRGQSLLSGNVFCGHCGGRLTLTTSGTVRTNANGERIGRKRIRYPDEFVVAGQIGTYYVCWNINEKILPKK